jgi:iron complex outermembrane receptor protein
MWCTLFLPKTDKLKSLKTQLKTFLLAPHLRFFHQMPLPNMRPVRNTITSAKPPTRRQHWKKAFAGVIIIALCGSLGQAANATDSTRYLFDIPAQQVEQALSQLAEHTGHQLLFSSELVNAHHSNAVSGEHTVSGALQQLLQSTPLTGNLTERGVIIVSDPSAQNQSLKGRGKMETTTKKKLLASMVGLFAAGGVATATAQDAVGESARAQGVLDEIIITATKRETSLQDTASSIAAIGAEELERKGIAGMEDYLTAMPGVSFLDQGVGQNNFIIRGIASDPEGEALRTGPSVGLYFGEVPLAGLAVQGGGANLRVVDIERVEVLRGPQGTLFGAGSLSGAVRNIPNAPNLEDVEGKIALGYSNMADRGGDNYRTEGVINIPLIEDKLAVRAVLYKHDNSGYIENVRTTTPSFAAILDDHGVETRDVGDVGATEYSGGRISALWRPVDALKINLQYVTEEAEQDGFPESQLNTGGYTQTRSPFGNFTFQSPLESRTLQTGDEEALEVDLSFTNLVVEYDFDWATLLSATSWVDQESFMGRDISLFFNRPVVQEASWDVDYFVQEVRLVSDLDGKFQYILGLYYEEMDVDSPRRAFFAGDLAFSPFGDPAGTGDNLLNDANLTSSLDQQAAFAELSYDISDQVSLTVGARRYDYERDSVSLSQGLFGTNVDSGGDVNNADETGTNYKVNLTYEPSDDSLIYAQWAEGFRPGNTVIPPPKDICDVDDDGILDGTNLPFADSFDADTLESYELGLKTSLMDNKMTFNVAVYHNDWNDIPISVQSPTCGFSLVGNAATARTQGFEVESVLRVSTDLQLIFGGSYVGSPPEK